MEAEADVDASRCDLLVHEAGIAAGSIQGVALALIEGHNLERPGANLRGDLVKD
jgi:hypothetical protein